MAIYQGIFGASSRFVRADNMAQAVHLMRQAFGFAPRGFITKAGDNSATIGSAAAYDQAASYIEGGNHRLAKAARVKSRARYAAGKGAPMAQGLNVVQF